MKLLLTALLTFILATASVCSADETAEAQANQDIESGIYKILLYGEPLAANIDSILYSGKTIKIDRVAGCVVEQKQVEYWNAYNDVVQEKLLDGRNVWGLLEEEGEKSRSEGVLQATLLRHFKTAPPPPATFDFASM